MKHIRSLVYRIALGCALVMLCLACAVVLLRVMLIRAYPLSCSTLLRYTWYLELTDLRDEHPERKYPAMSSVPGALFLPYEAVHHEFVNVNGYLFCIGASREYRAIPTEVQFAEPTYAYFGYALASEDEMLAFLETYPRFIESAANFDEDLPAPAGRGSFGGDQFLRLTDETAQNYGDASGSVPLIFEIPTYSAEGYTYRHWEEGGMVLYLSTHLKLVRRGEDYPLTPAVIERIGAIKAMYRHQPGH